MKSFLKYTLATITGFIISSIILFVIMLGIIGAIIASSDKEESIKANTILLLEFDKPIPDRTSQNPLENLDLKNLKINTIVGLHDIIKNIKKAKIDTNIKGIYLKSGPIQAGIGTIEEIRNALIDFKKSGKFIVSYADYFTHSSYYLATSADSIFINPQGELVFIGLRSETMFYKGLFEKLDIEPQIIRHGKFKSYVEPFISDHMSDANRTQINTLLSSVWGHLLDGISSQRHISVEDLKNMADNLTIRNAEAAKNNKLVDGIRYNDEIRSRLAKMSGVASEKKLEFVSLEKYNKVDSHDSKQPDKKIALLYATGEINMGEGDENSIGAEGLSKAIRKAREDVNIKAIVLRINSPGGSSLASDIIWRELVLTKKVKPIVVSMGSVAASGGYYIAAPANTIVADATTITGSIGVFGMSFNVKNFFNKKLGITTDVVKTNKHSDLGSIFRPLSPEEREIIQFEVENIYDTFITHVAEGRKMTKAAVDSIGQGRVWSASDAQKLGLIDLIGDLNKSIEVAAKIAHLKDYQIVELPKSESPLSLLFNDLSSKMREKIVSSELGNEQIIYSNIKQVLNLQGVQALMPYQITIY